MKQNIHKEISRLKQEHDERRSMAGNHEKLPYILKSNATREVGPELPEICENCGVDYKCPKCW